MSNPLLFQKLHIDLFYTSIPNEIYIIIWDNFLHILIKSMKILAEPAVVQRAEKTITSYNMKAIHATEEAVD